LRIDERGFDRRATTAGIARRRDRHRRIKVGKRRALVQRGRGRETIMPRPEGPVVSQKIFEKFLIFFLQVAGSMLSPEKNRTRATR